VAPRITNKPKRTLKQAAEDAATRAKLAARRSHDDKISAKRAPSEVYQERDQAIASRPDHKKSDKSVSQQVAVADLPDHLREAIKNDPPVAAKDRLDKLTETAQSVRDKQQEIADLESRAVDLRKQLLRLTIEELPALMDECRIPSFKLAAEGNNPEMIVGIAPFAVANISAKWEKSKRDEAFQYLEESGNGSLIKTTITIAVPREQRENALVLQTELVTRGYTVDVAEKVEHTTLSAWLKQELKAGRMPKLDLIGGHVGRVASVKPVKVTP